MNSISSLQSTVNAKSAASPSLDLAGLSKGQGDKSDVKAKFQDVVAGTFYKEMLKSFKKMHSKPAYFHGGQAEEIFQGQMDQQVAEDLAHRNGAAFADSLYQAFLQNGRV